MGGSPFGPPECAAHAVKHGMNAPIRSPWEAPPGGSVPCGRPGARKRPSGHPPRTEPGGGPVSRCQRVELLPASPTPFGGQDLQTSLSFSTWGRRRSSGTSTGPSNAPFLSCGQDLGLQCSAVSCTTEPHSSGACVTPHGASRPTRSWPRRLCTAPPAVGGAGPRCPHWCTGPDLAPRLSTWACTTEPHSCGVPAPMWGVSRPTRWSVWRLRVAPPALGRDLARRPHCALQAQMWSAISPRAHARRARTATACA